MKKLARSIVAAILGYQVRQLYKKNQFKVVGVVGSIGKTSTKLAIAQVLAAARRPRYQDGNYNDLVTVPLVFFGEELPSLTNPLAWLAVFWRNQKQLKAAYPYDFVVIEMGSDGPGQIEQFKKYLKLEIGVVTAITPEHMAFFADMDAVAREELAIGQFSSLLLVNKDLCAAKYVQGSQNLLTYGSLGPADYQLAVSGPNFVVSSGNTKVAESPAQNLSRAQLYSALAAAAVAQKLGLSAEEIQKGLGTIKPVAGRMQRLAGVNGSTIIDDSYNASPEAAKLALDTLYQIKAPQKIAVLGNMNELGAYSPDAHQQIGGYCDPHQLELVVTIGPDANKYLAKAAEAKGCRVERFDSPYKIGEFLKPLIKAGGVVLVKGSQNRVFAEEAIKSLLADPTDATKLVRQSPQWLAIKQKAFQA
jgi:UDP-N-acetylmuramoyl-tripeptide--D-alanyl-D-alanine ligase